MPLTAAQKAYRERNREKLNAYMREWRAENPMKVKGYYVTQYWGRGGRDKRLAKVPAERERRQQKRTEQDGA